MSIALFLSGAQNFEVEQGNISSSLGGYPSITPIPKNVINSLFSEISSFDIANGGTDTKAIFLKNVGASNITTISFQQVYEEELGEFTNICKFEWAFVEPNEKGFMELIGSNKETPYYADFVEPNFRREFADLKITNPGQIGDEIMILGVEATLTGASVQDLIDDVVESFKNNSSYLVKQKNVDTIHFKKKVDNFDSEEIELITPGSATANTVNFGGGIDESVELLDEPLVPNSYIGIWIKRTINVLDYCPDFKESPKIENLEVSFDF